MEAMKSSRNTPQSDSFPDVFFLHSCHLVCRHVLLFMLLLWFWEKKEQHNLPESRLGLHFKAGQALGCVSVCCKQVLLIYKLCDASLHVD